MLISGSRVFLVTLALTAACSGARGVQVRPENQNTESPSGEAESLATVSLEGPSKGVEAASLVRRRLAGCADLELDIPSDEEMSQPWRQFRAWVSSEMVVFEDAHFGNGAHAEHGSGIDIVQIDGCRRAQGSLRWFDGSLAASARLPVGHSADQLVQIFGQTARSGDPAHAVARLVVSRSCDPLEMEEYQPEDGWGLWPLTEAPQPWHSGRPLRSPTTYWSQEALVAAGWTGELESGATGLVVWQLGEIASLRSTESGQLFGSELPGRNRGWALAHYDPEADRHRWLFVTRGCVNGTDVHWFAQGEGLLMGYAESQHPVYTNRNGLLLLDLLEGRAWRVMVRRDHRRPRPRDREPEDLEYFERAGFGISDNGIAIRDPDGGELLVTMRDLRARIVSLSGAD